MSISSLFNNTYIHVRRAKKKQNKKTQLPQILNFYLFHYISHIADVRGNDQWWSNDAPHAELGAVLRVSLSRTVYQWFVITAALTTSVDEISIIPSTRTCICESQGKGWEGPREKGRERGRKRGKYTLELYRYIFSSSSVQRASGLVQHTCIFSLVWIVLNDVSRWLPLIMMVRSTPPRVGILSHPCPRILHTPLARVEEDRLPSGIQGFRLQMQYWNY